jgi:hypothetical protein
MSKPPSGGRIRYEQHTDDGRITAGQKTRKMHGSMHVSGTIAGEKKSYRRQRRGDGIHCADVNRKSLHAAGHPRSLTGVRLVDGHDRRGARPDLSTAARHARSYPVWRAAGAEHESGTATLDEAVVAYS